MKNKYLFALAAFISATGAANANLTTQHLYANAISARNISVIQHSIMLGAFQSFEGSAAAALAPVATKNKQDVPAQSQQKNSPNLYGKMPIYGTMPIYGEYNDDGSITRGRNGGDIDALPVLNNLWLGWQHFGDDAKFDDIDRLDSAYDLVMLGVSGGRAQIARGISEWGMFAGYVGGSQDNKHVDIDEKGGYFGIYNGYNLHRFNLYLAADAGAMYNSAESVFGTDEYANMWAGASIRATYDIALDDTFTLQPEIYAGYTWIKSANYISASGEKVSNKNFNMLEAAPGLRAIKHISNGWFGIANVRYVFEFANGGDVSVNRIEQPELDSDNYVEYGIGLEKSIDRFNISINLNRRDGGRTGWNGGVGMKYLF